LCLVQNSILNTMDSEKIIEEYLQRTGQSYQDLMGGLHDFGFDKILELATKANVENKKIVWKEDPELIDGSSFVLQNL